jgi:hypothetical protein
VPAVVGRLERGVRHRVQALNSGQRCCIALPSARFLQKSREFLPAWALYRLCLQFAHKHVMDSPTPRNEEIDVVACCIEAKVAVSCR